MQKEVRDAGVHGGKDFLFRRRLLIWRKVADWGMRRHHGTPVSFPIPQLLVPDQHRNSDAKAAAFGTFPAPAG